MKWFDCTLHDSRGFIAFGVNATGVIAIGINAIGVVAIGVNAIGMFSFALGLSIGVISFSIGVMFAIWASGLGFALTVLPCLFGLGFCPTLNQNFVGYFTALCFIPFELFVIRKIRLARIKQLQNEMLEEERQQIVQTNEKQLVDVNYLKRNPGIQGVIKGEIISLTETTLKINVIELQSKHKEQVFVKGAQKLQAEHVMKFRAPTPSCFESSEHICYFVVTAVDNSPYVTNTPNEPFDAISLELDKITPIITNNDVETKQEEADDDENQLASVSKPLLDPTTNSNLIHEKDDSNSSTISEFADIILECHDILTISFPENASRLPWKATFDWIWLFWESAETAWIWVFWMMAVSLPFALFILTLQSSGIIEMPSAWL